MREQASDQTPLRSESHSPPVPPPSQPYTLSQALRHLGNHPTRTGSIRGPVVRGFPYNNASPRIAAVTTPTVQETHTLPSDTLTRKAAEGRDSQHHHQLQRPAYQRQRTGGLFIEASDPSPPLGSRAQSSAGPGTEISSRGLFYTGKGHRPYPESELSSNIGEGTRRTDRRLPAARTRMSDKEAAVFDQRESRERVTRGQKAKRHCARWWWVYLIILICIIVLVVCLV